jgi:hypothetical protein
LQPLLLQVRKYRIGITRIDNRHLWVIPAADKPDIIVVEGVDASNFHHKDKPVRLLRVVSALYTR